MEQTYFFDIPSSPFLSPSFQIKLPSHPRLKMFISYLPNIFIYIILSFSSLGSSIYLL